MWKRRGVVCTTDRRVRGNILDELGEVEGVRERLFPVGRLDKDSSGLILLTSDGGLTNTLLRAGERKQKEYLVTTHVPATDADIARLAAGVVITTVAQSDGRAKPLTARTRPCVVERDASPAQPARGHAPPPCCRGGEISRDQPRPAETSRDKPRPAEGRRGCGSCSRKVGTGRSGACALPAGST
mmetsp:Transcript_32992/g.110124  ORF Transcript_32992/g.110124 Transcript_32992/m.110124 type:complete len:185 (+) Transcript_32992:159-713(+)